MAAYLALFLALGTGGAYAVSKIGPNNIKKNAVRAKHIKKGAVTGPKIKRGAVTREKLADRLENGLTGPQGPMGPAGPPGAALTRVSSTGPVIVPEGSPVPVPLIPGSIPQAAGELLLLTGSMRGTLSSACSGIASVAVGLKIDGQDFGLAPTLSSVLWNPGQTGPASGFVGLQIQPTLLDTDQPRTRSLTATATANCPSEDRAFVVDELLLRFIRVGG